MQADDRYWKIGNLIFDTEGWHLWSDGASKRLDEQQAKLLIFLGKNCGKRYTNAQIKSAVWDDGTSVSDSSLYVAGTKLRQFFGLEKMDRYFSRNTRPLRLRVPPVVIPAWQAHELIIGQPRLSLTPSDPKDDVAAHHLWLQFANHRHNRALRDLEWAWVLPFDYPKRIRDFSLAYRADSPSYEEVMPPLAQKALEWWREDQIKKGNTARIARLEAEPAGSQVRIVGMHFAHSRQNYHIDLAPAKFLHYVAIQQNLWHNELHALRQHVFENALRGINDELPLMLPCAFAIHMVAVSSDGKAILRQRDNTPIYPLAWEAGCGELMHGPEYAKGDFLHHEKKEEGFRHFNEKGEPDLSLYLRNTVKEELSYTNAKDDDFLIFGIAVEWRTLAPKLIVVYESDAPIDVLVEGAKSSPERARAVRSIDLSAEGITKSFTSGQYPTWGPTSKLALLLALIHRNGENQNNEVQSHMDELAPHTET